MGSSTNFYQDVQVCVEEVIQKVGKKIVLGLPLGLGKANVVTNEIYRRVKDDPSLHLKIMTGLTLEKPTWSSELERRFLEPFVQRVFGGYLDLEYVLDLRKGCLPENVEFIEFFNKPGGFLKTRHAQQNYISSNYTHAWRDSINNGVNVCAQLIAKKNGQDKTVYSLGCNPEVSLDLAKRFKELVKQGRKIATIGEVNQNMPYMFGDAEVESDFFDAVLDNPEYYHTLFGAPKMSVSTQDYFIGFNAGTLIKDGGTLQIGIGSLGDALVYGLKQRQQNNALYRSLAKDSGITDKFGELIDRIGGLDPFEKGLYGSTEMLVDGYMELYESGIIKRKVYSHKGLQRLINEERISEKITPSCLEALLEEKVIRPKLTKENFKFLKEFGIFKDSLALEGGEIVVSDKLRIEADLSSQQNLAQVIKHCLGSELKNGVLIHAGFFLGPQAFYEKLRSMSEEERRKINMTSVLNVNQLYGNQYGDEELKILQRRNARFVNAALMFTLFGGVVSDGLENGLVVSGVGGQYNFVSQAHALEDGRSILMAKSTRAKGKDIASNIVYKYGHITIPRHLRDIIITEYGIAELRSKPDKEIIAAVLNITDSRFQEGLLEEAKRNGKIPRSYKIPDQFKNNYPQRLEETMIPFREKGLFPAFPFGTDFTKEELIIGKALRGLKEKMADKKFPVPIPSFQQAKKIMSIPDEAKPYLERLKLDKPESGKEKMMQKMVIYALSSQGVI